MSKTYKDSPKAKAARKGRERHISVRAVRRDPPDLRKLSRALITLAMAEAAAQAENQQGQDSEQPETEQGDGTSEVSDV